MKQILIALLLSFTATSCYTQDTEFGRSGNGLIYSDTTIQQLKFIVDSLNIKFRVCDLNKTYLAKSQAKANFISLEKVNVKAAKKDMEAGISFEDFAKKYPKADAEKDLLVVKFVYKDYDEKNTLSFYSQEINNKYSHDLEFKEDLSAYNKPLKGKWVYKYYPKSEYSVESLDAFYFIEEFAQQPLPDTYAKMIQYSDCMVDTSTSLFYKNAKESGIRYGDQAPSEVAKFMNYVHKTTGKPEYDSKNYEDYRKKELLWDSLRFLKLDRLRTTDKNFDKLLAQAVMQAKNHGGSDDEFEEYAGRYYSKKTALELKRNRRVIGGCSQDDRPRVHALNIAKLSAETISWEIFLRSHLDIMNDRFDRMSDGSYAWEGRKTYIKELEVLDINVTDLLLGISLRIENPAENHYYGSIGRLGRALSETNSPIETENKMLQMITDNQLDDYNRLLIYYLFLNYNHHISNKEKQTENNARLSTAVNTLPGYLSKKINSKK